MLFAVKLFATETAAAAIRPLVGPRTAVISLMNGVDGPERMAAILGEAAVLPGAAYVSALITHPGEITYTSDMSSIVFGEYAGGASARGEAFAEIAAPPASTPRCRPTRVPTCGTNSYYWRPIRRSPPAFASPPEKSIPIPGLPLPAP